MGEESAPAMARQTLPCDVEVHCIEAGQLEWSQLCRQ
jgi:hypothetical protein